MDDDYAVAKSIEQSILEEIELTEKPEKEVPLVHEKNTMKATMNFESHNGHSNDIRISVPSNVEAAQANDAKQVELLEVASYFRSSQVTSTPSSPKTVVASAAIPELQSSELASSQRPTKTKSSVNNNLATSGTVVKFMHRHDSTQANDDLAKRKVSKPCSRSTDKFARKTASSHKDVDNTPLVCRLCGKQVGNWWTHVRDQHKHPSRWRWICVHCPKKFASAFELRCHFEAVHCLIGYRCEKCSRSFKYFSSAERHTKRLKCDPINKGRKPKSSKIQVGKDSRRD